MATHWTQRTALSATEIEILSALDFEVETPIAGEHSPHVGATTQAPADRPAKADPGWLASAYPDLRPEDRRRRATLVAIASVVAIVLITLVVFPVMAQAPTTP